jgi:hypothetical protein
LKNLRTSGSSSPRRTGDRKSGYQRLGSFGEPVRKRVGQTRCYVYVDIDKAGVLGEAKLIEGNTWTEMIEVTYGQLDPIQFSEIMRERELAKA